MAQSKAQGGIKNDSSKAMAQNGNHLDSGSNRGGVDRPGSAAVGSLDRGRVDETGEVTNAQTQNRLSPPLSNRAATLRSVANPLFRVARPVELGDRNGQIDGAGEVSGTGSTEPQTGHVEPVPPAIIPRKRGTGSTKSASRKTGNDLAPPTIPGHRWKNLSYGFELWRRTPAKSATGGRSSKAKYLTYYSKDAVRKLHDEAKTKTNT